MDAHGKCLGVEFGVDIRWGYIVNSGTGSHAYTMFFFGFVLCTNMIHRCIQWNFLYWAFLSDSSRWAARWGRRGWTALSPLSRTRGFFYKNTSDFFNNNQGSWGVRNGALFWSVFDQTYRKRKRFSGTFRNVAIYRKNPVPCIYERQRSGSTRRFCSEKIALKTTHCRGG
jgi:hypothetical protein